MIFKPSALFSGVLIYFKIYSSVVFTTFIIRYVLFSDVIMTRSHLFRRPVVSAYFRNLFTVVEMIFSSFIFTRVREIRVRVLRIRGLNN